MIELRSTLGASYEVMADAFNQSFEGYHVPLKLDAAGLEVRARAEAWDLGASALAYRDGRVAGVLFISRRGTRARVAGMGVVREQRRTGVGRVMIERAIADARARGDTRLTLEVIEANTGALALYESAGFRRERRLLGWEHESPPAAPPSLVEMELDTFAEWAHAGQEPGLPWQLEAATLANFTRPFQAFRLEHSAAALVLASLPDRLTIRALIVPREKRSQGHARALLSQLAGLYPGRRLAVPPIVPESIDYLAQRGFTRAKLSQWEMSCSLR